MIKLHQLRKHPKSTHRRKVVGRGLGSGHGTYSTRGGKGQTARTGHSKMPAAFEGGRQPLVRQLPKNRGFSSLSDKTIGISLNKLNVFNDGEAVTAKTLQEKGIIKQPGTLANNGVKILGGEIKKKLNVKVRTTAAAKAAIEKAGGSVK
jgi:large subunit ribosomal protein L15